MSRPNLFELNIWKRFEAKALEVFSEGLIALAQKTKLPKQENFISRELRECCRIANRALLRKGRGVAYVHPELPNLPLDDDEYWATRLKKCPDFTCGFHDDSVDESADPDLFFVIECKRLGTPSAANWEFNKNYVEHGISRFEDPIWGYAKGLTSGLMIGYIQSMEPASILAEVSQHATKAGLSALALASGRWVVQGLTILDSYTFNRRTLPTPFQLHHFWIDLRHLEFFDVPRPEPSAVRKKKAKVGAKKKIAVPMDAGIQSVSGATVPPSKSRARRKPDGKKPAPE